jgi:hypothetical protein
MSSGITTTNHTKENRTYKGNTCYRQWNIISTRTVNQSEKK